ncbi:MAG: hypothetical protein IJ560_03115 [Alphaproteobacteria bacterium]|nr:hypothetical protein [Alphaproteobacteria bacterium]
MADMHNAFDDWATHYDINTKKKVLFSDDEIWSKPWFQGFVDTIRNGQDIEKFIDDKNKKLHDEYIQKDIENIAEIKTSIENSRVRIGQVDDIITSLHNFRHDIEVILTKYNKNINQDAFKDVLWSYYQQGVFDKNSHYYNKLTQPPSGIINRLTNGFSVKNRNKDLDAFFHKYEKFKNTIDNLSMPDYSIKNYISGVFRAICSLDWQSCDNNTELLEKYKESLIINKQKDEQILARANNQVLEKEKSFQDSKSIRKEDSILRSFAQETMQEMQTPKNLDSSKYVAGLNGLQDDEMVMFNVGLLNNRLAITNCLYLNNLTIGRESNQWYLHLNPSESTDRFELFSPLMTVKDAKQVLPKLIADFDRAQVSSGLVVPIKAKQLFASFNKHPEKTEIQYHDLESFIYGVMLKQRLPSHPQYAEKVQEFGYRSSDDLPHAFWSLNEISTKYPKDKFLFSGTTASDDYLLLSGRAGRTGTIYATPNIEYAKIYDGCTDVGGQEGTTATLNRYVSSIIGNVSGADVHCGFINVYKRNPNDMYFPNFGMEDYRITNRMLTNNEVTNDDKAETFVTPEKNPLVEKFLHIKWKQEQFFVPVNENKDNKIIQTILNNRKANPRDTFYYDDVFTRLQKQEKEYKQILFKNAADKIPKQDNIQLTGEFDYDR